MVIEATNTFLILDNKEEKQTLFLTIRILPLIIPAFIKICRFFAANRINFQVAR